MKYFLAIVLFFNSTYFLFAQKIIQFKSAEELLEIGNQISFFEDTQRTLTIQEVLDKNIQKKFKRNPSKVFYIPISSSVYWIKFTVRNQSNQDIWLALDKSLLLTVDFYAPNINGDYSKVIQTGALKPFESRPYPVINGFWLPLNKANEPQEKTYYIRLNTHFGTDIPIKVATLAKLHQDKINIDTFSAIFIGIMLIMVLYNSFLFVVTKDSIYFLYTGYLVNMIFLPTFLNSYPIIEYLTGYQFQYFFHQYFTIWEYPVLIFSALFCIKYLELKIHLPKAKKWIEILILSHALVILLTITGVLTDATLALFEQMIPSIVYTVCLCVAFYLFLFKKLKQAKYYVLGWSFFFVGVLLLVLSGNGLIPYNFYLRNFSYITVPLEIWMFSLALGERMKLVQKEKELMQTEYIAEIEKHRAELRASNEELQSQEEELRQHLEALQTTQDFLETRQVEITQKNEDIGELYKNLQSSISYAQNIQHAILPKIEDIHNHLPQSFIFFKPRDVVSGDFYFFIKNNYTTIIAAVDCTGHGIPGAFMSLIGNNLLNEIVKAKFITHPDEILNELRDGIVRVLKQEESNNQDGMDIAVCSVEQYPEEFYEELGQPHLEYAGAGNPLIYFQDKELFRIKGDKMIIGGVKNYFPEQRFNLHPIKLDKPTTFYIFSDGIQDQFGGEENRKFGPRRLRTLLQDIHEKEMSEQKQILTEAVENWQMQGTYSQIDDMLLIGFRLGI